MAPLNILIVGCGIGGPVLATFLLLHKDTPVSEKPRITILERGSTIRPQGQNIDIRPPGLPIVHKLGLESTIRSSTTGEEGVQFVDSSNQIWAAFGADRTGKTSTPTADIEILRGRLAEICYKRSQQVSDAVQKAGGIAIEYIFGDHLDSLTQDSNQVEVHFTKSQKTRTFDLVIGADGLQSETRRLAWGSSSSSSYLHKTHMYAGFFSLPSTNTDSAWRRWYHASNRRGIMIRPSDDPSRVTALIAVVSDTDARLSQVAGHRDTKAQKALLEEYFTDSGWESARIIREMNASSDFYYDMVAQVKMPHWTKGRVALLGDAGYCASPISGMGTTLALNGAYHLAGAITRYGQDTIRAWAQYEDTMRPLVEKAQKLPPVMPWFMHPETAWGVWALNAIMWAFWKTGLFGLLLKFVGPGRGIKGVDEEEDYDQYGFERVGEDGVVKM